MTKRDKLITRLERLFYESHSDRDRQIGITRVQQVMVGKLRGRLKELVIDSIHGPPPGNRWLLDPVERMVGWGKIADRFYHETH